MVTGILYKLWNYRDSSLGLSGTAIDEEVEFSFLAEHPKVVSRRDVLRNLGAMAATTASPRLATEKIATQTTAASREPNILWITSEGVPLDALSCYGSRLIQTQHIDRIANEGMCYENAFCTNALCAEPGYPFDPPDQYEPLVSFRVVPRKWGASGIRKD